MRRKAYIGALRDPHHRFVLAVLRPCMVCRGPVVLAPWHGVALRLHPSRRVLCVQCASLIEQL